MDEPLRLERLIIRFTCALSKILGFLYLRIVKRNSFCYLDVTFFGIFAPK